MARSVIVKLKRLSVLWCECPSRVGSAAGAKARFKGNKEILDCNFLFWGGGGGGRNYGGNTSGDSAANERQPLHAGSATPGTHQGEAF